MEHLHPWDRRVQAEVLRSCPLEDVARALGYRRDPDDDARWRRLGSVVSINRFMFYDHLRGEGGAGAVDLVVHAQRCSAPDALAFLAELPGPSRRPPECLCPWLPHPQERHWPAVERYLVEQRGLSPVLLALCRDLGLVHADRHGNAVFVCRDAAGIATGAEIVPAGARCTAAPGAAEAATSLPRRGGFWISWEIDWPQSVLIAKSAIDALSALSLNLVPAELRECAVVSIAAVTPTLPAWIEDWSPRRIFCAYDATPGGDDAARRLFRRDSRVVRVRPALDGDDWNDMRRRDLEGNMLEIDDRLIG